MEYDDELTVRICNHIKGLYRDRALGNPEREKLADILIAILEMADRKQIDSLGNPLLVEIMKSDAFSRIKYAFGLSKKLRDYMGNEAHEKLRISQRIVPLYLNYDERLTLCVYSEILKLYVSNPFCKKTKKLLAKEEREQIADIMLHTLESTRFSSEGEAAFLVLKAMMQ